MRAEADRRGWVLVFPDGIAHGWNDGRPATTRRAEQRSGVDDVGFIAALIDELHDRDGIDQRRVYATGISNGGFMCQRLAIELSDRLAAVASVTASLPRALEGERPRHPVAMLLLNGTADPLVPYAGGAVQVLGRAHGEVLSTDATFEWWRRHNGCRAEPTERALPDRSPEDGTSVSVRAVDGCLGRTAVSRYRIDGGGHSWPGGRAYLPASVIGRVSREIDATAVIFGFFEAHVRGPTHGRFFEPWPYVWARTSGVPRSSPGRRRSLPAGSLRGGGGYRRSPHRFVPVPSFEIEDVAAGYRSRSG